MLDFEGFPYPFERIQFGENLSSMPKENQRENEEVAMSLFP